MLSSLLPLIGALVAVVAVIYLSYVVSKYIASGAAKMGSAKYMKTVDRVVLGQDRMLLIVSIGERYYLVGSAANSINILKEIPKEELEAIEAAIVPGEANPVKSFQHILKNHIIKKRD